MQSVDCDIICKRLVDPETGDPYGMGCFLDVGGQYGGIYHGSHCFATTWMCYVLCNEVIPPTAVQDEFGVVVAFQTSCANRTVSPVPAGAGEMLSVITVLDRSPDPTEGTQ